MAGAGRIRGVNVNHRFYSASVVKAMLALAVVRAARDRDLTAEERALLHPMITVSDNDAASTVYARVGADALNRIARAAGMTRFDVGFNWADALLTAHDQARLFLRIDRLAPRRHRAYLRGLLGSIVSWQRWGIAPVAEARGFHVMFKGGWRTGIFHQVALLERDGRRIALAVLTSGTDHGYGRETQAGIAARVLSRPPRKPVSRRPQAELELERAVVLDGDDAGDARRLDAEVGERDRGRAGELDRAAAEPLSADLHADGLRLAVEGQLAAHGLVAAREVDRLAELEPRVREAVGLDPAPAQRVVAARPRRRRAWSCRPRGRPP